MPDPALNLRSRIDEFIRLQTTRQRRNRCWNWLLVILGLVFATGTVIAGILNYGPIAACLAVVMAAIIATDRAGAFGDSAEFQLLIISESEIIRDEIDEVSAPDELKQMRHRFTELKRFAVKSAPVGMKMAAVLAMYKGIQGTNQEPLDLPKPEGRGIKTRNRTKSKFKVKAKGELPGDAE